MTEYTHIRESSEDTERHLSENRSAFETDCQFLLHLMRHGRKLSSQDVHDMRINDRRLRELESDGKCKKRWVFNENGKRTHVEYYIEIPKPITKQQLIENWSNLVQGNLL